MEITRTPGFASATTGRTSASPRQTQGVTEGAAQGEERDASRRIIEATRAAREAELASNNQIEAEREKYYERSKSEMVRQDAAYEAQRDKGNEVLTELKNQQQREISRIRREGEREISNLNNYYNTTQRRLETEGRQKVDLENRFQQAQLAYDKRNSMEELESARTAHRDLMAGKTHEQEAQLRSLMEAHRVEYERLKENLDKLSQETEASFKDKYQSQLDRQERQLGEVENRASQKLREIRADTSAKLSAYSSRQKDPFYKLLTHEAEFEEDDDAFTLTAKVPEHEQKNISVAIKGNQLVISGYRRNEEKLEVGPGRVQGTASYQSFSETFPLTYPVDAKNLTKRFDGDQLVVTVPKSAEFKVKPQFQAKNKPEPTRIEKPKFPENLPHVADSHEHRASSDGDTDDAPKPAQKGSRTLS